MLLDWVYLSLVFLFIITGRHDDDIPSTLDELLELNTK